RSALRTGATNVLRGDSEPTVRIGPFGPSRRRGRGRQDGRPRIRRGCRTSPDKRAAAVSPHDRFPNLTSRAGAALVRLRTAVIATLVVAATAITVIVGTTSPASAGPEPVMTGYVPLPADDFMSYLENVRSSTDDTVDFTVGVTNAATGSVMYYDHWEDGFEADLANPTQSTTLVFGDNDTGNGDAADFCDVCTGDQLPQGAALIMRNDVTVPRPASSPPALFDGGDKVASTRGFA
ncbi:hypothetical protein B7486_69315, partial [cyanobacterium TDX16]